MIRDVLVFTDSLTDRLQFTFDFICKDRGVSVTFTNDPARFEQEENCAKLVYSDYHFDFECLEITPVSLLFEEGIEKQAITKGQFLDVPCLAFKGLADPVASIFYILSSYECYLPFSADEHERFLASQSILTKHDWLDQPIADIWCEQILEAIKRYYPSFDYQKPPVKHLLTFDIDNSFAFKHKNIQQVLGGRLKDFLKGNQKNAELRRQVLAGNQPDPHDTFDLISGYAQAGTEVKIFWHLGDFKKYDRNISWTNAVHQRLIKRMAQVAELGIHPSYHSYLNESLVRQERGRLEHITQKPVFSSRQHFLKLSFPQTFQLLTSLGIKNDYSVGFADKAGFRLGTARTVPFYNLRKEEITNLLLHPFIYMDGTLMQYEKLTPEKALERIEPLIQQVHKHGGTFISIWHNHTINNQGEWEGWKQVLDFNVDCFPHGV